MIGQFKLRIINSYLINNLKYRSLPHLVNYSDLISEFSLSHLHAFEFDFLKKKHYKKK